MKWTFLLLALITAGLLANTGCATLGSQHCSSCGHHGGPIHPHGGHRLGHGPVRQKIAAHIQRKRAARERTAAMYQAEMNTGPAGPPTATYAYPYYTTRAPRDYFMDNPPSIGY